jgi:integrase
MARNKNGEGSITGPDKNGYYHFRIQTKVIKPNGNAYIVHTTSTISGEDAKKKGLKKKREAEKQDKLETAGKYTGKETFEFWVREYLKLKSEGVSTKNRWTGSTLLFYEGMLNSKFFNTDEKLKITQIKNLNLKMFQDYFDRLAEPNKEGKVYGAKNRSNIRSVFSNTLQYIKKQGFDVEDYAADVVIPQTSRDEVNIDYDGTDVEENTDEVFSEEDIKKIWDGANTNKYKYGYGYALMLMTGIRSEELFAITNDLIKIDEETQTGEIKICKAISHRKNKETNKKEQYVKVTKNQDNRTVYLDNLGVDCVRKLREAMKFHNNNAVNDKDLLIYDQKGKFVERDVFNQEFHRFCVRFDITLKPNQAAHKLRHTFVTVNNVKHNINPLITSAVVGHKDLTTDLKVYTHVQPEDIKNAIVNPLNSKIKDSNDISPEKLQELKKVYDSLKILFDNKD